MGYSPRGRKESDMTEQLHSLRNNSGRELFITILISLMRLWAGSVTYLCHTPSYVGLGTKKELMVELSKSGVVEVSLLLHTVNS